MKLLLVDNYDSFTYNLKQILDGLKVAVTVVRNDQINFDTIDEFDGVVLSPGPGVPKNAGDLKKLIFNTYQKKPVLGICLGMQAIGEVFNCQLKLMEAPLHGHATEISHNENPLFNKIPNRFMVGRYHSWIVDKESITDQIEVISEDDEGRVMGIKVKDHLVYGLQFHPESIMTPDGKQMIMNFLNQINLK